MLNKLSNLLVYLKPRYDDDSIDRLNYIYTSTILVFFALTMAAKQYVGKPLQCWVPAQFKGGWESYVENYCFVENTYWVNMNERIPDDLDERDDKEIQYYQALMFYFPRLIWSMYSGHSGLSIASVISSVMQTKKEGERRVIKNKDEINGEVVKAAQRVIEVNEYNTMKKRRPVNDGFHSPDELLTPGNSKRPQLSGGLSGASVWITVMYLFTKFLYILNVVAQLFILNAFLGPEYTFWGFDILVDLARGREWHTSGHFPRVTLCDFEVRRLGNLQRWTVQCVLMINMFNEKIYLFLWWWFLVVALCSVLSFVFWLYITFKPNGGVLFVGKFLKFRGVKASDAELKHFVDNCLHKDGITILRLLSDNAGDVTASAIVAELFKLWRENVKKDQHHADGFSLDSPPQPRDGYNMGEKGSPRANPILDTGYLEKLDGQ